MKIASRFMNSTGLDDASNISMVVKGDVTPVEFLLKPSAKETFFIERILPFLRDTGTIDADGWGNGAALTVGVKLFVRSKGASGLNNDIIWDITKQKTIKTNADWSAFSYDVAATSFGTGDQFLASRYTFAKEAKKGLILDGGNGEELVCVISDDIITVGINEQLIRVGFSKTTTL